MVAAPETSVAVWRHERQRVGVRSGDYVADHVGRQLGQPAKAVLLPRPYEGGDRVLVCDRRPGGGERDPPARAFATP
jgi:hypothetical protein